MLEDRIYRNSYVLISKTIGILLYPFYKTFNLFRFKYKINKINIKTILITEYHRIGDVLIIFNAVKILKEAFPKAKIILLCSNYALEIAREMKIADEVIGISVPWTSWDWSPRNWIKVRSFARKLRKYKIDLAFDFKGDIRNSWFIWQTKPKISFGYNTTGGGYFFSRSFQMNQSKHQSFRAIELVEKAGIKYRELVLPKKKINRKGKIVIHIGTSDERRSWPIDYWIKLVGLLKNKYSVALVKIDQSYELEQKLLQKGYPFEIFSGNLTEFKDWLSNQRCIIAPDSMAGHLAAYIGIPVFSIFGSQNPMLTSPQTNIGTIISPNEKCRHARDHWRLCSNCMKSISPKQVVETFEKKIYEFESQH